MKFETVVTELFGRLPHLEEVYRSELSYMLDEPPLAYIVFGDILIPELERALRDKTLGTIQGICAFLESAAVSSHQDPSLDTLMKVEIGEWLGYCANEDILVPWLGEQTKLVCGYVPGLATQRRA